jgi:hypothetical protein
MIAAAAKVLVIFILWLMRGLIGKCGGTKLKWCPVRSNRSWNKWHQPRRAAALIAENIIRELPVIFMPRADARADPEIWLHKAEMMSCRQPRQPIAEEIRSRHS